MKLTFFGLIFAGVHALAGAATTTFPEGATVLTTAALQEAVAGKVFNVVADSGPDWRWEFKANGYFFINVGSLRDTGPWTAKESALCTEGKYIKASCNEVRQLGTNLYLKRDNGNVVPMTPK